MKRIFTIVLFFCISLSYAMAKKILPDQALTIAVQFFGEQPTKSGGYTLVWDGLEPVTKATVNQNASLYAINRAEGGFIVISGDDIIQPVLAYSEKGEFGATAIPANVKAWFDYIIGGIEYLKRNNVTGSVKPATKSDFVVGSSSKQYTTASWDQIEPFNDKCPTMAGEKAVAGCLPTAMAIVMKYFAFPNQGTGTIANNPVIYNGIPYTLQGYNLGHSYDWANMPLSAPYSNEQMDQISQLLYDCGMMISAEYSPEGTSSAINDVPDEMASHFGYSSKASYFSYDTNVFTHKQWLDMLKENLEQCGPTIYSGNSAEEGHAFVIDGFSGDDFHINWGWGGRYNASYSFPDFGDYSSNHWLIRGLKPASASDEGMTWISLSSTAQYPGLYVEDASAIVSMSQFNIYWGLFWNVGNETFYGKIGFGLYSSSEELKEVLIEYTINGLPPYNGFSNQSFPCMIRGTIETGDHIMAIYKETGSDSWNKAHFGEEDARLVTAIYLTTPNTPPEPEPEIDENTSIEYSLSTQIITIVTVDDAQFVLTNALGTQITNAVSKSGPQILINTKALPTGIYTITISKADKNKSFNIKVGGNN